MIKKLLLTFFIFLPFLMIGQSITVITNSTSSNWSPNKVVNNGDVLNWSVADNGLVSPPDQNVNDPIFDFSSNDGSQIIITITSTDNFSGLQEFWLDYLNIISLDINEATSLIDFSSRGNRNLGTVDLSSLSSLLSFRSDVTDLTSIDFSANDLLDFVYVINNDLPTDQLDKIVNDLDANGASDGNLQIRNQSTGDELSSLSYDGYTNLINRGWTIDVDAPEPPV
ncbi:hypothetical protein LCM02_01365, partial [Lutimonas saemankumensis]|uniref:hypothetical protein n=1 Tax=Lutimonas saemankumensis TaxID=483016 RepID=UPI001CD1A63C